MPDGTAAYSRNILCTQVQQTFLHYDFPSFATGEAVGTKRSSANRRAIGHGSLAEKAILPALPPVSQFPYSLRITSEVTSSNGSSSMATTSGATLALLDAGVRILAPIAGVSIGLVVDEGHYCTVEEELDSFSDHQNYALMVDLTGTEDYYGEMDFKIAGSPHGITAMQLDVKYPGGVPIDVISEAMTAAKEGREEIFDAMSDSNRGGIADLLPRPGLKATAPRVEVIRFDPARKRDLIGPGGAILKQLESQYGVALVCCTLPIDMFIYSNNIVFSLNIATQILYYNTGSVARRSMPFARQGR